MACRGLFIGIDRYSNPAINWLSCAVRDATALHALFQDTVGGTMTLLLNEDASASEVSRQLKDFQSCGEDDEVFIYFSGHGSDTHELVTFDADPQNLGETSISLATLTELFSSIPARHLILVIDCCFSGGAGAKVLKSEIRPRSLESVDAPLSKLAGTGRLILTASSPTEPAWELARLGHGLLTYHLLQALQGSEEVRVAGRLPVLRVLEFVTSSVTSGAASFGKVQTPTLRGQLEGSVTWPIFVGGATYEAAFPERRRARAESSIHSLEHLGFPAELLNVWSTSIPSLNQLQLDAVNEFGVLAGEHLVVSAPTSSGKTLIGELAALGNALERKRTLFLLPLRALVNDKHEAFQRAYGEYGIRTIRATGEIDDEVPDLVRGRYDIALMTYEKFGALMLAAPHILYQVGTVVVDEAQMIADSSRGANLEFILTMLRMKRREGIEPQIIALSAVIGDTSGFERWLGARLLARSERPVPLDEGLLLANGTFRYVSSDTGEEKSEKLISRIWGKDSSQDWIIPLVRRLVGEGKQVIVFRETKGEARGCSNYLADNLGLPAAQSALDGLPSGDDSSASKVLKKSLQRGVGLHISDLDRDERRIVEFAFREKDSKVRALAATTTLAMGVNTPAEAVVIAGLMHPGDQPYSVAEYKNIVGRAGRLGFSERGASFLLALNAREADEFWRKYIRGNPEDLTSRFLDASTDPRTMILRVLASAGKSALGMRAEEIVAFLEASFGVYQRQMSQGAWQWDRNALSTGLSELLSRNLIDTDEDGHCKLTDLGRLAGAGGVEVETILRMVDALRACQSSQINDQTLLAVTQCSLELDNVFLPVNVRSKDKEPATWEAEVRRQQVATQVINNMYSQGRPTGTVRAKKAAACLLWTTSMPLEEIESILTKHGGSFDGIAGPVRSVNARTVDVLPAVAQVAEILHPDLKLGQRVAKLLVRLNLGLPPSLVEVGRHFGTILSRTDYLTLAKSGLLTLDAIAGADDSVLLSLVGNRRDKLNLMRSALERRDISEPDTEEAGSLIPIYES